MAAPTTAYPPVKRFILISLIVLCAVSPAQAASGYSAKILSIEPTNLVGYWALDETSGIVALDTSGNNRHAYYSGVAVSSANAPDGYPSPYWDGINDQLYWDTSPTNGINAWNPDSGTISFWFNLPTQTNYASMLWLDGTTGYFNDFLGFDFDPGGGSIFVYFVRGGTGGSVSWYPAPAANTWHHITIVFDATSYTAYLDGTSGGSQSLGTWGGGNLVSPRMYPGNEARFARFALWDIPLSAAQVTLLASWQGIPQSDPYREVIDLGDRSGYFEMGANAGESAILFVLLVIAGLLTRGLFVYQKRR